MARRVPTVGRGVPPPGTTKYGAAIGARPGSRSMMPKTAAMPGLPIGARPVSRSMMPGTAGGMAGGVLSSQLRVADRPVTQQGLSGMKTASQGPNRQVLDRSYFLGLLRSKIQEVSQEVTTMNTESEAYNQDNASFLAFEKKAEQLANEIKGLRGEMADYNTLMDKLNTDTEIEDIMANYHSMSRKNEQEARDIDIIFSRKQEKEREHNILASELETKKKQFKDMISSMDPEDTRQYQMMKENNAKITKDLQNGQDALDSLTSKIEQQKDELSMTPLKQEALKLRQKLSSAKSQLEDLEKQEEETPQQEQERLLCQVKTDNKEIGILEKRCVELQDKLEAAQKQLQQVNYDLSHLHGERSSQYKDLKLKEKAMKDYFDKFEEAVSTDKKKICQLESDIVVILEHISQSITQSEHMPSLEDFEEMQANLGFKEHELGKTKATTRALDEENTKLQADLRKVEDLETKISAELDQLKSSINTMATELITFRDLEGLQISEEKKRKDLSKEKEYLSQKRGDFQRGMVELSSKYEEAETKLNENDTYSQLNNLEHKWQHHEQSNYAMKEFISVKRTEGNYVQACAEVSKLVAEYNKMLCSSLSGAAAASI